MHELTHNTISLDKLISTVILGTALSVSSISSAYSAETIDGIEIMDGPKVLLKTPVHGPFAPDYPPSSDSGLVTAPAVSSSTITSATSTFIVNYASSTSTLSCGSSAEDWNPQAQAAFSYAASIWANLIHSTSPIVIEACWTSLASNILGSAGPRIGRSVQLPVGDTWYPFALIDAVTQRDVVPASWDIQANFNKNFDFYYGTDGVTPSSQYDFVTVVLHEIGHGLGFSGGASFDINSGSGTVLHNGYPSIYTLLTKDGLGQSLLSYTDNSTALGSALTGNVGGGVFFHGSSAMAANGGQPVPLYTPPTWNSGSSYSHLGEVFNGSVNDLMTYSVSAGTSLHHPGPVGLAVLKDMGWPTDNDNTISRAIGSVTYDPSSDNAPYDTRGTLSADFDLTHNGTESFNDVYLLVNNATAATLNNATSTDNNGGVGSILSVSRSALPGANFLFENSETLTIPLVIDIAAGGRWSVNFDVLASDEIQAKDPSADTAPIKLASFTLDSSMLNAEGITLPIPTSQSHDSAVVDNVMSGRVSPLFIILLTIAAASLPTRRQLNS